MKDQLQPIMEAMLKAQPQTLNRTWAGFTATNDAGSH
jgi:hypothetical protein